MKTRMTHAARAELVDAVRGRYSAASGKAKRRILDEFIAASGYHEKSAIRVLNEARTAKVRQTRKRPALYDEASRAALIVLWEASDRVYGKRLKALLPLLLAAMERNGHLKLEADIRAKVLFMSAATIDRLLRTPRNATRARKPPRVTPEPRRRIKMRTFADWNDPAPGSMEMDLVAHCGPVNRGSYVNSLVLTDIATGWTEAAPIVVREGAWLSKPSTVSAPAYPSPCRPSNYSSSSRLDTQAVTAKDNCIPFRSESEYGGSRPSSGLLMRSVGRRIMPLSRLDRATGNLAHEASGNKIT